MNRNIINISKIFIILFIALIFMNTYWSFWREKDLSFATINPRNRENLEVRGGILASGGEYLAKTIIDKNKPFRFYPEGELTSHIVGYLDPKMGKAGLEYSFDDYLKGRSFPWSINGFKDRWKEGRPRGYNIYLTLNLDLCKKGYDLLGERQGAIIVINPVTGDILASVSKPSFAPDRLDKNWSYYRDDKGAPLLNRVIQGQYTPGSIFKVLILSAALEKGIINENDIFDCPGFIDIDGHRFYCGRAHGRQNYIQALANSCNMAFASIGLKLGEEDMLNYFEKFFGYNYKLPLPSVMSVLKKENISSGTLLGQTAFGQGELLISPLDACLMVSVIANKGKMMYPQLIKEIRDYKGRLIEKSEPGILASPISSETADRVKYAMEAVVNEGTGYVAYINGIRVAGKTGTAEQPKGNPHAWFVCLAPADNPTIAVAVVIEGGGSGGEVAAPIGREIILNGMR